MNLSLVIVSMPSFRSYPADVGMDWLRNTGTNGALKHVINGGTSRFENQRRIE